MKKLVKHRRSDRLGAQKLERHFDSKNENDYYDLDYDHDLDEDIWSILNE